MVSEDDPFAALATMEAQAREEASRIKAEIAALDARGQVVRQRLAKIQELQKLYAAPAARANGSDQLPATEEPDTRSDRVIAVESAAVIPVAAVVADLAGHRPAPPPADLSIREHIHLHVRKLLEERNGEPMHINNIHVEFEQRGWYVPGRGRPANISAHLSNAEGFYSPRRGEWALGNAPTVKRPVKKVAKKKATRRRR